MDRDGVPVQCDRTGDRCGEGLAVEREMCEGSGGEVQYNALASVMLGRGFPQALRTDVRGEVQKCIPRPALLSKT